ncbi:MAG: tetratricopeptide repeat protein, partial [Proteobacteria bacterium]|nr:tetratricopeptide repeat protein [Pseudomonadota bacterium]
MSNDPRNQTSSTELDHLLVKAQQYYSEKHYSQARRIFCKVLKKDPTHKVALYLLALCELYSGHQNEAATTLKKLVKRYPKHINGLVLLSKINLSLGDHLQSTQYARQA